jgi:putative transposase
VATTAGISGQMIRDMMVRCLEQRFAALRPPHPVLWLPDNGSIFTARRTIEIALALDLELASLRLKRHLSCHGRSCHGRA